MPFNSRPRAARRSASSLVAATCALVASCSPSDPLAPARDGGRVDGGDPDAIVALRIEPPRLELISRDGAPASGAFTAIGIERDGDERELEGVAWSLGLPGLATLDRSGTATIDGTRGGSSAVLARFGGEPLTATAELVVRLEEELLGPGVDAGDVAVFEREPTASDDAPVLLYPLDGAMMPRNLRAPVVQWRAQTGDGDLYRVRARSAHVAITAYFRATPGFSFSWSLNQETWRRLADADLDAPITFEIDRHQVARDRVLRGAPVTMRVARGGVLGEVFYWALDEGRIHAIQPATGAWRDVVPNPPAQSDGQRCIACHTISRDGRWLFGRRFDDDASWIVDLSEDTTTDPPPMRYAPRPGVDTASFDPTGDRLLAASEGRLFVIDAATGLELPATGLPDARASMPTWSPAGARVAWIESEDLSDPASPSVLRVASHASLEFTELRTLHRGTTLADAPEGGARDALPSWTPDDRFLVIQHGLESFTSGRPTARAALYLVDAESGETHRLDAATSERSDAFWPTVSPFVTDEPGGGRFYWVAFHSRRDYGNDRAGTWGTRNRQLWITAVDADPEDGADPSHAPIWLPGQSLEVDNVAAYWAPESCRGAGQSCADGSQCCSGECVERGDDRVCDTPPG